MGRWIWNKFKICTLFRLLSWSTSRAIVWILSWEVTTASTPSECSINRRIIPVNLWMKQWKFCMHLLKSKTLKLLQHVSCISTVGASITNVVASSTTITTATMVVPVLVTMGVTLVVTMAVGASEVISSMVTLIKVWLVLLVLRPRTTRMNHKWSLTRCKIESSDYWCSCSFYHWTRYSDFTGQGLRKFFHLPNHTLNNRQELFVDKTVRDLLEASHIEACDH